MGQGWLEGLISNQLPFSPVRIVKSPLLVSGSFDWIEDVLSQGQGTNREALGSPVPSGSPQ